MTEKHSTPTPLQALKELPATAAKSSANAIGDPNVSDRLARPARLEPAAPLAGRTRRRTDDQAPAESALTRDTLEADAAATPEPASTDLSASPSLGLDDGSAIQAGPLTESGSLSPLQDQAWRSEVLLAQVDVSRLAAPGFAAPAAAQTSGVAMAASTTAQTAGIIVAGGLAGMAALAAKSKDATAPKVDSVSDDTPESVSHQDVVFRVSFSEALVGTVGLGSFEASNGTVTAVSRMGQSNTYLVTVAPTPNTASAEISLRLIASGLRDAAGNWAADADLAGLGRQSIDTLAPTLLISSDKAALGAQEVAQITFTFSEDPGTSFGADDVAVTGGTLGAITGNGLTRTATFTPAADQTGVNASITVVGGYKDGAGNSGAGASAPAISLETRTPVDIILQDGYLDGADLWVDMDDSGSITDGDIFIGPSVNVWFKAT